MRQSRAVGRQALHPPQPQHVSPEELTHRISAASEKQRVQNHKPTLQLRSMVPLSLFELPSPLLRSCAETSQRGKQWLGTPKPQGVGGSMVNGQSPRENPQGLDVRRQTRATVAVSFTNASASLNGKLSMSNGKWSKPPRKPAGIRRASPDTRHRCCQFYYCFSFAQW